jgi:heterodisulfide reductase subunit C
MMNTVNITASLTDAQSIRQELKAKYDADVGKCYQCGKCSAGCPVSFAMDYPPHKVIQLAKLGRGEELMQAKSTWLCATCHCCSARCPREVYPSRVMEGLRIESRNSDNINVKPMEIFNSKFLDLVEKHGRVHELALIMTYNLKTAKFLKDAQYSPSLMLNGKLAILPHTTPTCKEEVRQIFERVRDYNAGNPVKEYVPGDAATAPTSSKESGGETP